MSITKAQTVEIERLRSLPWRKDPFLGTPIDQALYRWINRKSVLIGALPD